MVQENICRLQIAVNEAMTMGMLKSLDNFKHQFGGSARRERAAAEQVLQRPAIHILHDEEFIAIGVGQDRMDGHDTDVAHLGRGALQAAIPSPAAGLDRDRAGRL